MTGPTLRPVRRLAVGLLVLPVVLPVILLAGCKEGTSGAIDAPVPVLTGTVSDAMLPYDTVTSEPPLDPRAARSAKAGPDEAPATEAAAEEAPAEGAPAAAAAAPAAAPAAKSAE